MMSITIIIIIIIIIIISESIFEKKHKLSTLLVVTLIVQDLKVSIPGRILQCVYTVSSLMLQTTFPQQNEQLFKNIHSLLQ